MIRRFIGVITFLLGAMTSGLSIGQTLPYAVEIIPDNPTSLSPITVRIGVDQCNVSFRSITYPGPNTIRIDLDLAVCPGTPFGPFTLQLGLLPAGTYTVEVFQSSALGGSATFLVAATPASGAESIPTLSNGILVMLAIVIFILGLRRSGRSQLG